MVTLGHRRARGFSFHVHPVIVPPPGRLLRLFHLPHNDAVAHAVLLLATSGSKSSRIADSGQSALPNKKAIHPPKTSAAGARSIAALTNFAVGGAVASSCADAHPSGREVFAVDRLRRANRDLC
jgi:hypothetical protein